MNQNRLLREKRQKRALRVRKTLHGTAERPRLSVFRSCKHVSVQLIDDRSGNTLVATSSSLSPVRETNPKTWNSQAAAAVGKRIAELALEKGIKEVRFDRGPYKYHGRLKALADAARKAGLSF
jgi:large subunit ribosomal protein L18